MPASAHQAELADDRILKKFWDDLADDWLALDSTLLAAGSARISPALVSQKYSGHA